MSGGAFLSNRVSRWTLAYFACALLNFMIAQALMIGGWAYPAQSLFAPDTFAAVHLITLGWLTLLMFGALLQFVPVISSQPLPSQKLALVALILLEIGVLGMVAGFVAIGAGASRLTHCLPFGGTLVALGALLSMANITIPLLRARPLPLPGRFIVAGFGFLIATMTLGLLFSLALTVPATAARFAPLLGSGIGMHALAGFGGWFTLTAIGVSYKLLPMFMLAPEERGAPGEAVFYLCVVGFAVAFATGLGHLYHPTQALAVAMNLGLVAAAAGLVFYLADVARIYRTRRRAVVELHNRAAVGSFVALALALMIAAAVVASGTLHIHGGVLGFVVLFGWLGGLGLTQLYKIVPFLTWLGRFGSRLGRGPVPRVQDLVDEKRAMHWFHAYFAAVAIGAVAGFAGQVLIWRIALAVCLAATVLLALEYWRAWRGTYAARPRAPIAAPPKFFEGRS